MKINKVLLLHIPQTNLKGKSFIKAAPLGFVGLGNYIKDHTHVDVKIINLASFKSTEYTDIVDYIISERVDLVCISLNWHYQAYNVLEICRQIKEVHKAPLISLGGFTASWYCKEILEKFSEVDFIIRGDGEIPLVELIDALNMCQCFDSISNLVWRDRKNIIINEIGFVSDDNFLESINDWNLSIYDTNVSNYVGYTGADMEFDKFNESYFFLPIGRGCNLSCSYCAGSRENQKVSYGRHKIALRNPISVINTIEKIIDYGINRFYICFDLPVMRDGWYDVFFSEIAQRNLDISIVFECFNLPSKKFIEWFSRVLDKNHSSIILSPTSLCDQTREKYTSQNYKLSEFEDVLNLCNSLEVTTMVYFALLPTEEDLKWESYVDKVDYIINLNSRWIKSTIMPIKMEPGSPWFMYPDDYSVIKKLESFNDYYEYHKYYYNYGVYKHLGYEFEEAKSRYIYYKSKLSFTKKVKDAINKDYVLKTNLWIHDLILNEILSILESSQENEISIFLNSEKIEQNDIFKIYDQCSKYESIEGVYDVKDLECEIIDFEEFTMNCEIKNENYVSFNNFNNLDFIVRDSCMWIGKECYANNEKIFGISKGNKYCICDHITNQSKKMVYEKKSNERNCINCYLKNECSKCLKSNDEYCRIKMTKSNYIKALKWFIQNRDIIKKINCKFNSQKVFFNFSGVTAEGFEVILDSADVSLFINKKEKRIDYIKNSI